MAILNLNPETLLISSDEARKAAEQYAQEYQGKEPYAYGGFDNFLPEEILDRVLKERLCCIKQLGDSSRESSVI
ncbi:MAG: hypothetical protein ACNA7O_15290, partial [Rhodobacterales bacterium]